MPYTDCFTGHIPLNRYLRKEHRCFAELLEIIPERYQNVKLTKDIFPFTSVKKLTVFMECHTVCDLLYFSPYEIWSTKYFGKDFFENMIKWLINYCKNNEGDINTYKKPVDFKTGRLFIILNYMLNKEPPPKFNISEEEQKYINRFNEAMQVIPKESLYNALNQSSELIDIDDILSNFYDKGNYIQRLNNLINNVKDYITCKSIHSFARIYLDTFDDECKFLLRLPKKTPIYQLPDKITDKEISNLKTAYSIYRFIKWLTSIDIEELSQKVFINNKMTEQQKAVLQERINGKTLEQIGIQYGFNRERTRQVEVLAIRRFKEGASISPHYFIRLIYAINGRCNLKSADLEQYLSKEQAKIFWYVIYKGSFDCEKYHFIKDKNILFFDKDKT